MPLIGDLPQPITSGPVVFAIYVVIVLMIGSALASVLLRRTTYAIAAYCGTLVLIAAFYLLLGVPFLLFALQLLVFSTVSAAMLLGLLRRPAGVDRSSATALRSDWIVGAGVCAGLLALLLVVVVAVTTWPVGFCCALGVSLGATLSNDYVVGLAVLVVLVTCAALGAGLLLGSPVASRAPRLEQPGPERRTRRRPGRVGDAVCDRGFRPRCPAQHRRHASRSGADAPGRRHRLCRFRSLRPWCPAAK